MNRKYIQIGALFAAATLGVWFSSNSMGGDVPDHVCNQYQRCDATIQGACPTATGRCDSCSAPYWHLHCVEYPFETCGDPGIQLGVCGYWRYGWCDDTECTLAISQDACNREYCN